MSVGPSPSTAGALVTTTCPLDTCQEVPCEICVDGMCYYRVKLRVVGPRGWVTTAKIKAVRDGEEAGWATDSACGWQRYPTQPDEWITGAYGFYVGPPDDSAYYCPPDPGYPAYHFSGQSAAVNGPAYVTIEVTESQ